MGLFSQNTPSYRSVIAVAVAVLLVVTGCSSSAPESERAKISSATAQETSPPATDAAETSTTTPPATPDEDPLPQNVAEMVPALEETELAVADADISGDLVQAWGRRQQMLYQVMGENPDWASDVEAGLSDEVKPSFVQNWKARQAPVSYTHLTLPTTPYV